MNPTTENDTIVQEITIKAPAERIFEALTNPGELVKWWGAQGKFQATHVESDLRPGGKWMMRCDGCGGKPTM
ncbi:MAG TPA: SRPBCC domain-containing protein, partial [Bryobacteraceae bacterium]|nr:SRPBCC domain-containing protein [Bryobacteraceae bacterium]